MAFWSLTFGVIAAMAGCASAPKMKEESSDDIFATKPPAFLTGPTASILAMQDGFSATAAFEQSDSTNKAKLLTGQLLGLGNLLLFAPKGGDRIFVWNAHDHTGYVFSEALQGYAPISSSLKQTTPLSIINGPTNATPQKFNGHPGREVEVAVGLSDGKTNTYKLWCAEDLQDFPIRIQTMDARESFTLSLSDYRAERLATNLFLPPDGFVKYDSAESMTGELAYRKTKSRVKVDLSRPDVIPMPQPGLKQP